MLGLNVFFDSVFGFLLFWPALVSVLFVSLVVSLIIVLSYKFLTDQKEMKRLKDLQEDYRKKMKTLKDNPDKLLSVQKEAMAANMEYMKLSFKPTLITMLPILLIFGWMNAHFAFDPLVPNTEFLVSVIANEDIQGNVSIVVPEGLNVVGPNVQAFNGGKATFRLKGIEGAYLVTFSSNGEEIDKDVLISSAPNYAAVSQKYSGNVFRSVELGNKGRKIFWRLSWIWIYIIGAILFSSVFRKALKVY